MYRKRQERNSNLVSTTIALFIQILADENINMFTSLYILCYLSNLHFLFIISNVALTRIKRNAK